MRIVTAQTLENWLAHGKVLEQDGRGPKVAALEDGLFLKIFHSRRHPLLARLQPAARRFQRNTEQLRQRGIAAPEVTDTFWLERSCGLSGCLYQPLPGQSLEQLYLEDRDRFMQQLPAIAAFIRQLHHKGIYFRSLHLGNILLLPDGQYGLIDCLDLRLKKRPLGAWQIRRNFAHLRRYLERKPLPGFPLDELLAIYSIK